MNFTDYAAPGTPDEVLELLKKKQNRIAAGNLWLRLSGRSGGTMIDLKNLGWDRIEETEDAYIIGASVSLRALELHEGLNRMTGGLFAKALKDIVGVQFRNAATVGGSLSMRAGFSDVLTLLLPLDAAVLLYPEKEIPLEDFAAAAPGRELIRGVRIPKQKIRIAYRAIRNTAGNVPVLTCAAARRDGMLCAAIGARPRKAQLVRAGNGDPQDLLKKALELPFGTNAAATEHYRRHLAKVLLERCLKETEEGKEAAE
ncbi:MAG: hypothetical protein CW338_09380 [Clostridiales bacterium]|nr:hypothetical protein [Clostridiales bacterium]